MAGRDLGALDPFADRLDIGVPVFFVLSGFLIYAPFVVSSGSRPRTSTYALRRLLRIVPAYWVALAYSSGAGHPWRIFDAEHLQYTLFGQIYSEQTVYGGIGAAWSLCTEMTFYAMVPLLAWLLVATGLRSLHAEVAVLVALAAVSLVLRPLIWNTGRDGLATSLLLTNLLWFSLGMLLAVARAHPQLRLVAAMRGVPEIGDVGRRRAAVRLLLRRASRAAGGTVGGGRRASVRALWRDRCPARGARRDQAGIRRLVEQQAARRAAGWCPTGSSSGTCR